MKKDRINRVFGVPIGNITVLKEVADDEVIGDGAVVHVKMHMVATPHN